MPDLRTAPRPIQRLREGHLPARRAATPGRRRRADRGPGAAVRQARRRTGERRGFTLTFRGPREVPLEQSIYPLEHGALGRQEIFLVPVGEDEDGRYYEAVFT